MIFEDGYIGEMISRTKMAGMLMFAALVTTTSASIEISGIKNMSRSRFLQYREHPQPAVCPDGYVDVTNGSAYYWDCGATCPGHFWTTECCSCACLPREVAWQEPCGSRQSRVMIIKFQQQKVRSNQEQATSARQSSSNVPAREEQKDKIKRLVLYCSITLCAAACITFWVTFVLFYGITKKGSRVHPKVVSSPRQFEIDISIKPANSESECTNKQEKKTRVMTPRSVADAKKHGFRTGAAVIQPNVVTVKELRFAERPHSLSPRKDNANARSPRRARSLSPHS